MTTSGWLPARRLRSQGLDAVARTPLEVVRRLGAVQAQNGTAARWAIGVRSAGSTVGDVEEAFIDGSLVRSWTMRGTLHIVAAEDLDWMLSITSARQRAGAAREALVRGISESDFERASEIITHHIGENGPSTRAEALAALTRGGIDVGNERGYRFIRDAALRRHVAWGPTRGKQPELVLTAPGPGLDRDATLARFIIRYAAGHAPVMVRDFAWWAGLTLTDARTARDAAGSALEAVNVDGAEFLIPAETDSWEPMAHGTGPSASVSDAAVPVPSGVHAVPAWDEYVLGYGDRSGVLAAEFAARVSPTGNGIFLPAIVSSGRVVGTWRQHMERGRLVAEAEPFTRLTASERRGFEASVTRLAGFLRVAAA